MNRKICGVILLFTFWIALGYSDKINVAFVIDDTNSMSDEINQVKEKTELMFNAVLRSPTAEVENFILITFNDYPPPNLLASIKLRAITMDPYIFLTRLREIYVHNGGDCPELAMNGVKLAIEQSKPNSYVYAFTDASARDYQMMEEVKAMAQKKSIQVNFLLTGVCNYASSPDYVVYDTLARATSGEVFHLLKHNIRDIINYIMSSIESPKTILATKPLRRGQNVFNFTVDEDMKNVTIAASTKRDSKVDLEVTDPSGAKVPTTDVVNTKNSKVVNLADPNPGIIYKFMATSDDEGVATIKSSISIDFEHGFSVLKPTSLETTRTRPVSGEKSRLAIKLKVKGDDDVRLETIQILDLDDNVLKNITAETINHKDKFYVTGPFDPPTHMFKVKIIAVNQKTGGKINRVGRTPVEPATMPGSVTPRHPVSIIKDGPSVFIKYDYPLQLECLVNAFPQPSIVWEDADGVVLPSSASTIELPYDYISVLDVDHVKKNTTYICKANNGIGVGTSSMEIKTSNPFVPPKIYKTQSSKAVLEGSKTELSCRVKKGFPKPTISWEFKRTHASEFVSLPSTFEKYVIDPVNPDNAGFYKCKAVNTVGEDSHKIEIIVQSPPTVVVTNQSDPVKISDQVTLECKVTGNPLPEVRWMKDGLQIVTNKKYNIFRDNTLRFMASLEDKGNYTCEARNDIGEASNTTTLNVYGPVKIVPPKYFGLNLEPGSDMELLCDASGSPTPKITWKFFSYRPLLPTTNLPWSDRLVTLNRIQRNNVGYYTCIAENGFDQASITYEVDIKEYPTATEPVDTLYVEEGTSKDIKCNVPRIEPDAIRWYKNGTYIGDADFVLPNAQDSDAGVYSCRVSSPLGFRAAHLKVVIGRKPNFKYPKKSDIIVAPFVYGQRYTLECVVEGIPTPTVTWWHNEIKMPDTVQVYRFKMHDNDLGEKRCDATNAFGTISRTYVIKKTGCEINYNDVDVHRYHPLITLTDGKLAEFENEKGVMIIPPRKLIEFVCPNNVTKSVYCVEKKFIVRKQGISHAIERYSYEDLKCATELTPETKASEDISLGNECSSQPGNSLIKVGYQTTSSFTGIYDVCYNTRLEKQIFIKHTLNRYASNIEIDTKTTFNDNGMPYDYDDMYNCSKQFYRDGKGCCFVGRQLVSPLDVLPDVQKSTYFNLNVLPQWNFCGNFHNWNEVEKRVRDLAKSIKYELQVYTGPHKSQRDSWLYESHGKHINAPMYFWKVVEITNLKEAIAIITVNVPNLTPSDAGSYVFCNDICDRTDWMANKEWHNVEHGYTFCCSVWEFIKKVPVTIIPDRLNYSLLLSKKIK
ncbi:hemicentin-2-like [Epargyreus clarus]|uniref:hemicentin-2-like n=1 Tax=Epargyreus clarus TaxID=520877 RepID=UPI003C2CB29C